MNYLRSCLIAGIMAWSPFAMAQGVTIDTILVTNTRDTRVILDRAFNPGKDYVELGSFHYHYKIEGSSVLLRARWTSEPFTSLVIKNGTKLYQGIVGFSAHPPESYDLRTPEDSGTRAASSMAVSPSKEDPLDVWVNQSFEASLVNERLSVLMNRPVEIHTLGVLNKRLLVALSNVMIDEYGTYIKLMFHNKSNVRFELGSISFRYVDPSNIREAIDVYPLAQQEVAYVDARKMDVLGFALPLTEVTRKGKLIITIKNLKGTRELGLSIPGKALMKTKTF